MGRLALPLCEGAKPQPPILDKDHERGAGLLRKLSASPKPDPSKPHPCNMPQAKTEVALQFSECCAAGTALQHWLFSAVRKSFGPKAALQQTKNCTATSKKLHCRKVALSCRFPAAFKPPTFRHPRFGPAENKHF